MRNICKRGLAIIFAMVGVIGFSPVTGMAFDEIPLEIIDTDGDYEFDDSGMNISVVEDALDVNGDGVINLKDVLLLLKYVNKKAVVIY